MQLLTDFSSKSRLTGITRRRSIRFADEGEEPTPLVTKVALVRSAWQEQTEDNPHISAFVAELSKGVEVVLRKPTLLPSKKKAGILYSEDGGKSLSWIVAGPPYSIERVSSRSLVNVKQSGSGLKLKYRARPVGKAEKCMYFDGPNVADMPRFLASMNELISTSSVCCR
jgi:hypothetical protein